VGVDGKTTYDKQGPLGKKFNLDDLFIDLEDFTPTTLKPDLNMSYDPILEDDIFE